jgi:hypothetical protein
MGNNPTEERESEAEPACKFCRGRFDVGYHFTCHTCGATYCYVHMSRHLGAHGLPNQQEPRILTARETGGVSLRIGEAILKPDPQKILS